MFLHGSAVNNMNLNPNVIGSILARREEFIEAAGMPAGEFPASEDVYY